MTQAGRKKLYSLPVHQVVSLVEKTIEGYEGVEHCLQSLQEVKNISENAIVVKDRSECYLGKYHVLKFKNKFSAMVASDLIDEIFFKAKNKVISLVREVLPEYYNVCANVHVDNEFIELELEITIKMLEVEEECASALSEEDHKECMKETLKQVDEEYAFNEKRLVLMGEDNEKIVEVWSERIGCDGNYCRVGGVIHVKYYDRFSLFPYKLDTVISNLLKAFLMEI